MTSSFPTHATTDHSKVRLCFTSESEFQAVNATLMWGTEAGWLLLAAATAGVAHGTTTSPPGTSALAPPDDFIDIVWAPDAVRTHLS